MPVCTAGAQSNMRELGAFKEIFRHIQAVLKITLTHSIPNPKSIPIYSHIVVTPLFFTPFCWWHIASSLLWFCVNFVFHVFPLGYLGRVGADVPATETSSRKGEATSRAGALQEVFDVATDTLAERQPLQRLPSQVTPDMPSKWPPGPRPPHFSDWCLEFIFHDLVHIGSMEENMAG